MRCKFYPTIHLWFLSDNVSQGVQHRSFPHLLPPWKPRNSFSMGNHCWLSTSSSWSTEACGQPEMIRNVFFHVLSTCLQSRWRHEIEREDSWSFQFHIMSTKDLRSLNSGDYCKTGFLDFLVKSSWSIAKLAPCPGSNLTWVHQLDSMGPAISFQKFVRSSNRNCKFNWDSKYLY